MKFIFIALFQCFFCSYALCTSITDTSKILKNKIPTSFFYESGLFSKDSIKFINSELKKFEVYTNRLVLGNLGLAQQDLFLYNQTGLGFNYSRNYYSENYYSQKNFKYYNTRTPFSEVFYVAGSKKEQFFKMIFSYNIKNNWNVTVDFKKMRSVGFYLKQNVAQTYVALSSNYKSKNNRYYILGNIMYNSPNHFENGGITSDSLFEERTGTSRNSVSVNLTSARKKINSRGIYVKQYFNLGKKSVDTLQKGIVTSSSFSIKTSYSEDRYKYTDEDPLAGFYDQIYRDSTLTNDSSKVILFENEFAWKKNDNQKYRGFIDWFGLEGKIRNQLVRVKQFEIDSSFNNLYVGGRFYNTYSKKAFWYSANVEYCLQGYNSKDYEARLELKKGLLQNSFLITAYYLNQKQSADFIYNTYTSNHFIWNNTFIQTETNSIGIKINSDKYDFDLGIDYSTKSNITYFDNYAVARQYTGQIPIFKTFLRKDIKVYDFHLDNTIVYQNVPDSLVIRLPKFVLNHSLYFEKKLFKKAMLLQAGVSLLWFSEFYGNAFMPATSQFYLQSDKKIGNYPFVDFFVNAQIKTVRIFVKVDHLNSGMSGSNYFVANHYPLNDRAFKLGISWKFFD